MYVGSLSVAKGVPLLIDAVRRLPHPDMRLRARRRLGNARACAASCSARAPRTRASAVCPGDPLPRLRAASLCVHPAYEDGFGYAPAEALACGVPVIVSEDTGMKELIDRGATALVAARPAISTRSPRRSRPPTAARSSRWLTRAGRRRVAVVGMSAGRTCGVRDHAGLLADALSRERASLHAALALA